MSELDRKRSELLATFGARPLSELEQSARHWEAVAEGDERMAAWEQERGISDGAVGRIKAETARRCAQALRMQEATGVWHCTCCLKPMTAHDAARRKP